MYFRDPFSRSGSQLPKVTPGPASRSRAPGSNPTGVPVREVLRYPDDLKYYRERRSNCGSQVQHSSSSSSLIITNFLPFSDSIKKKLKKLKKKKKKTKKNNFFPAAPQQRLKISGLQGHRRSLSFCFSEGRSNPCVDVSRTGRSAIPRSGRKRSWPCSRNAFVLVRY